jgi:hypothetical protein
MEIFIMKKLEHSILILSCFILPALVRGGSYFSSRGLGIPIGVTDARSIGMAGLAAAQSDPYSVSGLNPAGLVAVRTTLLSMNFYSENNRFRTPLGSAATGYANFNGFLFALPLKKGLGVALQLRPLTRMDYRISYRNEVNGQGYDKNVESRGGINTVSFSVFWRFVPFAAVGVSGNYLFGLNTEKWNIFWDDSLFTQTNDRYQIRHSGTGATFGIQVSPFSRLLLGAMVTPSSGLSASTDRFYALTTENSTNRTGYPAIWSAAATLSLGKRATAGVEYTEQDWDKLTWDGIPVKDMRRQRCLSAGAELFSLDDPLLPYHQRMAYRLGFSYQPFFSLDVNGKEIREWWATFGLGFPMAAGVSQIDAAFAYGKRGSLGPNTFSENLFKLAVSVSVSERWFARGRR